MTAQFTVLVLAAVILPKLSLSAQEAKHSARADLTSPSFAIHANLPQYQFPGRTLSQAVDEGRSLAQSKGIEWQGLNLITTGSHSVGRSTEEDLKKLYADRVCKSDTVVMGAINAQLSHPTASNTGIYTDYSFLIENILHSKPGIPIHPHNAIVVTRPGGSLQTAQGMISMEIKDYPNLEQRKRHLLFLNRVKASGGFHPYDGWSTLVESTNGQWNILRPALAALPPSWLGNRNAETAIGQMAAACPPAQ